MLLPYRYGRMFDLYGTEIYALVSEGKYKSIVLLHSSCYTEILLRSISEHRAVCVF